MIIFQVGSMLSVLPASLISSTYTDRNSFFLGLQTSSTNLKLFPIRVSIEFSQIAFPKRVLPEDDRTDSFREERLDLPRWTMISAICASVDVSKYLDVGIFNNVGASSILT